MKIKKNREGGVPFILQDYMSFPSNKSPVEFQRHLADFGEPQLPSTFRFFVFITVDVNEVGYVFFKKTRLLFHFDNAHFKNEATATEKNLNGSLQTKMPGY